MGLHGSRKLFPRVHGRSLFMGAALWAPSVKRLQIGMWAGSYFTPDGESVFKMAYNSRTEINVCFDVAGDARVRMAEHPPVEAGVDGSRQVGGPWPAPARDPS